MADLSHYDFVEEFSLEELASLIAGHDPKLSPNDELTARIATIRRALIESVDMANADAFLKHAAKGVDVPLRADLAPGLLYPSQILRRFSWSDDPFDLLFVDKALDENGTWHGIPMDEARFARLVVRGWLAGRRFTSGYDFDVGAGLLPPKWHAATQSLDAPEQGIASPVNGAPASTEKPLSNRERDTLLTIIAVLCKEANMDYAKPAKTAGLIQSTADSMGVAIGETTIENHLKRIPDALAGKTR